MKRLFLILFLLLASLPVEAQIVTATATVTNQATNGFTFSVNGTVRTWTNSVSSFATQIPIYIGTNTAVSCSNQNEFATNLWLSYITYPQASLTVQLTASNVLTFISYPGVALTLATNGTASNWVTFSYVTNQITNETVVRIPTNALGIPEQSNSANGIISYINSTYNTNLISPTAPAMASIVGIGNSPLLTNTLTISNGVSTIMTNWQSGITSTNWKNTNVDCAVTFAGTNVAIYDQNSNLFWGPGTFASQTNATPFFMRTNWFLTNSSITLSWH